MRVFLALLTLAPVLAWGAPESSRGERLFKQRCGLCHPVDRSQAQGPGLGQIVGRQAASLKGFQYSPALRAHKAQWTADTLDKFLAAPSDVVPGTTMPIPTPDADERHELIAYLATLHDTTTAKRSKIVPARIGVANGQLRTGKAALGDFRDDAPGVRRRVTVEDLPRPFSTKSAVNDAQIVASPELGTLRVPRGFSVDLFAHGLRQPRLVRTAPNGDLFVAESMAGRIVVLRAKDPHRGADQIETFCTGLDRPFGIAFHPRENPRWVYVAENNRIVRYPYQAGDLHARGTKETIIANLGGSSAGHWTRDIVFSADGKRMFVSIGSTSNVDEGASKKSPDEVRAWEAKEGLGADWAAESHRAGVRVFDADGKNDRAYATGIRNCVGMAISPQGALWCSVNERDGLGDDLVPDYVTSVREGAFYGWPWFYLGAHEDPRHPGARPDLTGKITVPDMLLQAHSAPLQMTFYDGETFPAEYRGDAFVALHGSWNRARHTGYKVVRIRVVNGKATGEYEDFLTGFALDNERVSGRPVGITVGKDGALYVTEDGNGTMWRIAHTGP